MHLSYNIYIIYQFTSHGCLVRTEAESLLVLLLPILKLFSKLDGKTSHLLEQLHWSHQKSVFLLLI